MTSAAEFMSPAKAKEDDPSSKASGQPESELDQEITQGK